MHCCENSGRCEHALDMCTGNNEQTCGDHYGYELSYRADKWCTGPLTVYYCHDYDSELTCFTAYDTNHCHYSHTASECFRSEPGQIWTARACDSIPES
jgi:hypothetical protein